MAGAPADGNPGRERGDEARQRAEARALASLLRGSGPQYPFPVEEIEEQPSEPEPVSVPEDSAGPAPPVEREARRETEPPPLRARRRRRAGHLAWVALAMLFLVFAAIAGLGTLELARSRARVNVLADELRRARAELGAVRDDFRNLRADFRSLAEQLPPAVPTLLDQVEQSVVSVRVGGKAVASGFAVEPRALPKGYRSAILTRLWVGRAAKQGRSIVVIQGRRSFHVRPGEVDEENGLALLFTKAAVPSLAWATDAPRVGEFVAGVGFPGRRIGVATGAVTAIGPHALLTDARLTPGSGGGPVVNRRGDVVGVARAGRDGLVTATPIDRACRALVSC